MAGLRIRYLFCSMSLAKRYEVTFFTATVLEWKHLLADERYKDIVMESLRFLVKNKRIVLYAFAIMDNHMHLIWEFVYPHKREDVQRDFLKYTAQMIIKGLRNDHPELLLELYVGAKDRKYQVWERNPLSVDVYSEEALRTKLDYLHHNPVKANLCLQPEDYKYSSASFYSTGADVFDCLTSVLM